MTKKRTTKEKIDEQFRRWCDLLPMAVLSDAGLQDGTRSGAARGDHGGITNEYLNAWEQVAFRMPQDNETNVDYDSPDLSDDEVGKLRAMALMSRVLTSGKSYVAKDPLKRPDTKNKS